MELNEKNESSFNKHFEAIALGKGEMKTIALNFFKYPFQFLFALLVLIFAQLYGLLPRFINIIFQRKELL